MYLRKIETVDIYTDEEIELLERQEDEMNFCVSSWDCETFRTEDINKNIVANVEIEEEELPF